MTDQSPSIAPVHRSVTVPLPPDEAFRVFTDDIALWWPTDSHSLSAQEEEDAVDVEIEPRVGGQVIETRHDGRPAPWADVTHWEPGRRLALDWYVGRDRDEATQVEVTFTPTDSGGTLVEVIHGGFDRLGSEGETLAANYNGGWAFVLGTCFGHACRKRAA